MKLVFIISTLLFMSCSSHQKLCPAYTSYLDYSIKENSNQDNSVEIEVNNR